MILPKLEIDLSLLEIRVAAESAVHILRNDIIILALMLEHSFIETNLGELGMVDQ